MILKLYDNLIGRLLKKDIKLLLATGLHQVAHKNLTFYWRINKHEEFINHIGINNCINILPRMSRDFLLEFNSNSDCSESEKIINSILMERDNKKVFKVDNRGKSLFVELIYSNEVYDNDKLISKLNNFKIKNFKSLINFVAIKNGEHNGNGYFAYNTKDYSKRINKKIKLKELKNIIEEVVQE